MGLTIPKYESYRLEFSVCNSRVEVIDEAIEDRNLVPVKLKLIFITASEMAIQ